MHGDTTGLEPTDSGSASDPGSERSGPAGEWLTAEEAESLLGLVAWLYKAAEYKAAREVEDALTRYQARRSTREGQRRSEGLHGEDQEATQIDDDPHSMAGSYFGSMGNWIDGQIVLPKGK